MKTTKIYTNLIMLVIALFISTGCSQKQAEKNDVIRVAHFPNISHAQALVGRAEGQFEKAFGKAVHIEWKEFNAGPSELEAFLAGEVDIGYIGPGPAINGFVKSGGELQIIAGASSGGAIFISRKDLIISDLKQLSGKKLAVPQIGNTQDLTLRKILQENNLQDVTKGGTVEILQAKNPDIKTLLDKGDIDAAFVPEPWGARLIKEVNANVILDYDEVMRDGNYSTAVVIVRKDFLQEQPVLVEKFLKTHVELTDYISKNLEQEKQVVNKEIHKITKKSLDNDVLDASFSRLKVTYNPEIDSINDFINLSLQLKYLKEKPDISELVNLEILNKVLKEKALQEIKK